MKEIKRHTSECYCINLRRASNSLSEFYDQKLKSTGLSVNQFSILKNIKRLRRVSISDLAVEVGLERTTLVRGIKPLSEKGYIVDVALENSRKREIELSQLGKDLVTKTQIIWEDIQKEVKSYFDEDELNQLIYLLNKIEKI